MIDNVRDNNLIFAKQFEIPKCKPWDLKKGRRFPCCHRLKEEGHGRICFEGEIGRTIHIPNFGGINGIKEKCLAIARRINCHSDNSPVS